jgi:phage tail sheath protein FI
MIDAAARTIGSSSSNKVRYEVARRLFEKLHRTINNMTSWYEE